MSTSDWTDAFLNLIYPTGSQISHSLWLSKSLHLECKQALSGWPSVLSFLLHLHVSVLQWIMHGEEVTIAVRCDFANSTPRIFVVVRAKWNLLVWKNCKGLKGAINKMKFRQVANQVETRARQPWMCRAEKSRTLAARQQWHILSLPRWKGSMNIGWFLISTMTHVLSGPRCSWVPGQVIGL